MDHSPEFIASAIMNCFLIAFLFVMLKAHAHVLRILNKEPHIRDYKLLKASYKALKEENNKLLFENNDLRSKGISGNGQTPLPYYDALGQVAKQLKEDAEFPVQSIPNKN